MSVQLSKSDKVFPRYLFLNFSFALRVDRSESASLAGSATLLLLGVEGAIIAASFSFLFGDLVPDLGFPGLALGPLISLTALLIVNGGFDFVATTKC